MTCCIKYIGYKSICSRKISTLIYNHSQCCVQHFVIVFTISSQSSCRALLSSYTENLCSISLHNFAIGSTHSCRRLKTLTSTISVTERRGVQHHIFIASRMYSILICLVASYIASEPFFSIKIIIFFDLILSAYFPVKVNLYSMEVISNDKKYYKRESQD